MCFCRIISIIVVVIFFLSFGNNSFAAGQKFISIEPHFGFGSDSEFYVGGKVYNYEGTNWTRSPYYQKPGLILKFKEEKLNIQPNSEGYFWIKTPIKANTDLSYGNDNPNQVTISLDTAQNRQNKKLILVTDYGLNTDKIYIPFIIPDLNSKYGIISDFDDTITRTRKLGLIELITTNPRVFRLREGIVDAYNKLVNNVNPIYYVTARPNGTYKVVETLLNQNNLPKGAILARDVGFWFLNKGWSIREHKIKSIESILDTISSKRFILIGDNDRNDLAIYKEIQEKYPKRIIKIFIFHNKNRKYTEDENVKFVNKPEEIVEEVTKLGLIGD